ncbi:MAG: hypothetical protein IT581_02475 [Verrucomicrobiales bacterium]|nr:hypothetical protein [Verrucomicrobiales bacterium]
MGDFTLILDRANQGDPAAEALLAAVYDELRRAAAAKLSREAPGYTLQATALVHEAWLSVVGSVPMGSKPYIWRPDERVGPGPPIHSTPPAPEP